MNEKRIAQNLDELQFPPPGRKAYPGNLARGAAVVLLAVAGLFAGGLAISQAVTGTPIEGPGGLWGSVFFLGIIAFMATFYGFIALRIRGFRVEGGVMTLVTPVRIASGKRLRRVPLAQVAHAERITQLGADPGILVTLRDGTRFPIFDGDLPGGGKPFLDTFLASLGERGTNGPPPSRLDEP